MTKSAKKIQRLKKIIQFYGELLPESVNLLPSIQNSKDGGRPYVQIKGDMFHYMAEEKGEVIFDRTTDDEGIILYWIFSDITHSLASKSSAEESVVCEDPRRKLFENQINFLNRLNKEWAEQRSFEIERKIEKTPFDDNAILRARLSRNLRKEGVESDAAWKTACEKYPLPKSPTEGVSENRK